MTQPGKLTNDQGSLLRILDLSPQPDIADAWNTCKGTAMRTRVGWRPCWPILPTWQVESSPSCTPFARPGGRLFSASHDIDTLYWDDAAMVEAQGDGQGVYDDM
jgi:hypothetical protein